MFQLRDVYQSRERIGLSTSSIGDCLLIYNHIIGIISLLVVYHLRIWSKCPRFTRVLPTIG